MPKYGQFPRDTLVGVVSFGVECAHPEYAGVYTDVTAYLPWIKENVQVVIMLQYKVCPTLLLEY